MNFTSDNTSGVAPRIMQAMMAANDGHVPSYGADPLSAAVQAQLRILLDAPQAQVFLVSTGTAANALSCAALTDSEGMIFTHRHAHIVEDEKDAPLFYTRNAELVLLDGADNKFTAAALKTAITYTKHVCQLDALRGMVSLTNVTEAGALYSPDEVAAIADVAHQAGLYVHMDGARFANAVSALNCTPGQLISGVDVLSFGGTKNGCLAVEAIVFLTPELAEGFADLMKRGGHVTSKMRYLAAQMMAYLDSGLWLRLAGQANRMAKRLSDGILAAGGSVAHPVQANEVFATLPRSAHDKLHAAGARYYYWPDDPSRTGPADEQILARLVCSWATTSAEVDRFLAQLS
ncbi:threonine aldolase [Thioclava sp. SK-1]|uniref:threonine aldolase family protein n=1 Tax=Thioclava sp. SK-1 TaxID=1889770 RepID=UPI000824F407|nr:beta-eliminating lyase-related protein [Thioclava sp. SK-1]OCX67168.1 threonine aldolase [Thioclava sp. SK-1]